MTPLIQALYDHALEHQIDSILLYSQQEYTENQRMAHCALNELCAAGPACADPARRLQSGMAVTADLRAEAAFQAGLSTGLALARL